MTDETRLPQGVQILREPSRKLTAQAGLPTAQSRIELNKSSIVIIPALQDSTLAAKPLPVFTPVRDPMKWIKRGAWLCLALVAASITYMLAAR